MARVLVDSLVSDRAAAELPWLFAGATLKLPCFPVSKAGPCSENGEDSGG